MNIQNNTNELVEVLNMVNMLGNDTDNGSGNSSGITLPTFDYATGSSRGSYNGVNVQCNWKYGSTGPADLVIFYGYKWSYTDSSVGTIRLSEATGCPIDGKFNSTSNYTTSGGILAVANDTYVAVYCSPYDTGFTLWDREETGTTFNYVAYKFNHIS